MNQKGIDAFKEEIHIGDDISVNTRHDSYFGKVKSISEDCFRIDENGLISTISFAHVWAFYKESN